MLSVPPANPRDATSSFQGEHRLPIGTLRQRGWIYALLILMCSLAAIGLRWAQDRTSLASINFITSDARGYYVYLPSMAIDGDLNFENQVRQHWDTESQFIPNILSRRTPLGLVRNKYPIGLSLTLIAPFTVAHGLTHAMSSLNPQVFRPDGYSVLYQLICLGSIQLMAWGTLVMADAWITRQFRIGPGPVITAAILILLGSNYAWYVVREPFMVHVASTFWVTASLLLVSRVTDAASHGQKFGKLLTYLGLCMGMALVCRPSNVFLLPLLIWLFIRLHQSGRLLHRGILGIAAGAVILSILPFMAQMSVWHAMTGHWIYHGYEGETFRWTEPRLFKTLFSSLHGLFTWTPLYVLPVIGIGLWLIRSRTSSAAASSPASDVSLSLLAPSDLLSGSRSLLIALIACAGLLWYINSAWHCWYFGWAFGGRAFLELLPVFILGLAMLLSRAIAWPLARKRLLAGVIGLMVFFNFGLMLAYQMHWIPRDDYFWGQSILQEDPASISKPGM